jgi:ribonuclease P protein component
MSPSVVTEGRLPEGGKPYAFPRHHRLLDGEDFKQVFGNARRVGNPHWTLLVWKHGEPKSRLGLAIAKRYVRRAHERNRLKRIAREVFRHLSHQLQGKDFVVMSGKMALNADNLTLHTQLNKLFAQFSSPPQRS